MPPLNEFSASRRVVARPLVVIAGAVLVTMVFTSGGLALWLGAPAMMRFRALDLVILIGLWAVTVAIVWLLAATWVIGDAAGLRFRNGLRVRRLDWGDIAEISAREGDPWPRVVLHRHHVDGPDEGDPVTYPLMGLQLSGSRSVEKLIRLRELHDEATH